MTARGDSDTSDINMATFGGGCLSARCRQTRDVNMVSCTSSRLMVVARAIRANVALVTGTVDTNSPSCAKTLGLTFSCQAAAAAATSAASRAQRSTIMALVTSRHHLYWDTRGARLCVVQAGGARGGRRRTGGPGGYRGRACAYGAPRSRMRGAAECGPCT